MIHFNIDCIPERFKIIKIISKIILCIIFFGIGLNLMNERSWILFFIGFCFLLLPILFYIPSIMNMIETVRIYLKNN